MKVLFLSPNVPWPPDSGGRIRSLKLIQALQGKAEIHLRAVCAWPGEEALAGELLPHCRSVQLFPRSGPGPVIRWTRPKLERWFHSRALREAVAQELSSEHCDLVHLDEVFLARALPNQPGLAVAVHHHKLDSELHEQLPGADALAGRFDLLKLRRLEDLAARRYRHHIVCSEEDARTLRERYPGLDCAVVENGFDAEYFQPSFPAPPRDPGRLLFLGTMSYEPNIDAMQHFAREILPLVRAQRPEAVLEIVGADPTPAVQALSSPGIRVLGGVANVRQHLERCAVMVAPLRIGGGSRIKLIEALGMATPTVSTTIGAEGLRFQDREHLRIADGPLETARVICELLENPVEASRMGERGRAFALEHHPWSELAKELLAVWQRIATGDQHAPS